MHLASVEIKNFRGLEHLTCKLRPGLNVVVGRNNTGKTTLLHAIRHAIGQAGAQGDTLWLDKDDFFRPSAEETTERRIEITLTFANLTPQQRSFFYEIVDFDHQTVGDSRAVIRYQAYWPKSKAHATVRRLAGPPGADDLDVGQAVLQALPVTFLPALRDAEAALAPGYRSRLAALLRTAARKKGDAKAEEDISTIYKTANKELEGHPLIRDAVTALQIATTELAGTDYTRSAIRAAAVEFDRVLRSLQVQMDGVAVEDLRSNGLGYNNLLYIAVVLQHLLGGEPHECPLFLVEEPEAHLHPQLVVLLANYLATNTPGGAAPQTILTTHSPTIAANVPPERIHVLFAQPTAIACKSLAGVGLTELEQGDLQRMMDVTRAALYFAKGIVLVEGISEALLVPALARLSQRDLGKGHISVIPICGVGFHTFQKVFSAAGVTIPVAIVTDADPRVIRGDTWHTDLPEVEGSGFKVSPNAQQLVSMFGSHPTVRVFVSQVTLEFDLADASPSNAALMAEVWESCFSGKPGTFNRDIEAAAPTPRDKALAAWRGICRAEHSGSKARFAQRLAAALEEKEMQGTFVVPRYLKDAISFVAPSADSAKQQVGAEGLGV